MADIITIDRYAPVLDFVVPVAESLACTGEAVIETSAQPKFVGHAADLQKVCYMLYPFTDTHVSVDGGVQQLRLHGNKGSGADRFRLNVTFRNSWRFDETPVPSANHNCLIKTHSGKGTVAVTGKSDAKREMNLFSVVIGNRLGLAARPADKMAISFNYMHLDLYVSTPFQDFEPLLGFRNSRGREGQNYPVSERAEYTLTDRGRNFFGEPLYWNARGKYYAALLEGISGKKPLEDYISWYKIDAEKFGEIEPSCHELIELAVEAAKRGERADLDPFCRNLRCPPSYQGIFLKPALATLRYFMSHWNMDDPAKRGYAQAIVDRYNECYARPKGRPDITIGEFCSVPAIL